MPKMMHMYNSGREIKMIGIDQITISLIKMIGIDQITTSLIKMIGIDKITISLLSLENNEMKLILMYNLLFNMFINT